MQVKRIKRDISGVILLDKPLGFSSNQALQKVKHLLQAAKAGHTGSLDPLASGLLPLCFGEATKFSHFLLDADKSYRALVKLGSTTTTGDAEGEVLTTSTVEVTAQDLDEVLKNLTGDFPIRQIIGPGQTVSNNFDQDELELMVRWRKTEITSWNFSLSQVERKHEELPVRDYSGTNFRVEWLYRPSAKVQINATLARQIIGISDASNSDALADQKGVGVTWNISPFTTLKINYRPQTLKFNGTDGLGPIPRTDRLSETSVALDYLATRHVLISTIANRRSRQSSQIDSDYSADSFSVFLKYAF